jgi:di/tricarboxylate transporter
MVAEALIAGHAWQMWAVFALVLVTVAAFVLERMPLEVTATLLLGALLLLFQVAPLPGPDGANRLDAARLLQGFANPGLITVVALLVVGQALIQTGALEGVASAIHRGSGGRPAMALAISLVPVAVLSAVLNNTPVVVIFIPIMSALADRLRLSSSRLLIPLSFASILGGMTTLIGSSTNLLVAGVVRELGLPRIGFFDFFVPGAVLAAAGLAYVLLVAPRLLPDRASMAGQLAVAGHQFIAQVEVLADSALVGEKSVAGMFRSLPGITVRMVQRGEHAFLPPLDSLELEVGDVIVAAATRKALTEALARHPRALHPSLTRRQFEQDSEAEARWHGGEQALAEVMVTPASRLIGRALEQIGFRHQHSCIVLGVQRRSRMIRQRVTQIRLEAGDVLLIQGPPEDVQALRADRDVVLLEWSQQTLPRYHHARRAAAIFAAVVLLAATDTVPIVVAAVAGVAAMLLAGCLNARQAGRAVDRTVVMTVAATLALGTALHETGGAAFVAHQLVTAFAGAGPAAVLSALFLLIAVVTNVLSNNASAVLFTPIAVSLAAELGIEPMVFVHAVIFAASCSFALPVGYQTNLLVMAPGHYRFVDFVRSGAPLILILWVCFTLFAPWYYGL